ncbi:MAG: hypothetical protein ACI8ZM_003682 [Crocinitomix sp.]|jgi:hypothetical protein
MTYYQESKKLNLRRMAWTFPVGLFVIFGLTDLYAYVVLENPASFFNFLITGVFTLFLGLISSFAIDGAKIRNKKIRLISMVFFSIFGLCCAWIFFLALIFKISFFTVLAGFPAYLLELTDGFTRNGGVPYFSWLAEAGAIISFPLIFMGGSSKDGDKPYCEPCDKWLDNKESILLKLPKIYTLSELVEKIEAEGIRSFLNYERAYKKDANYYEFTFYWCVNCRDGMNLTVKRHFTDNAKTFDKKDSKLVMNLYELEESFQWEELYDGNNDSEDRFNFVEEEDSEPESPESYDPKEFDELEEL